VKFFFSFILSNSLLNILLGCTYCAAQDASETINVALIPLAILICIPYLLFWIVINILKRMSMTDNYQLKKGEV
jgi:hypothetical protein